jgi:hypothetical protein
MMRPFKRSRNDCRRMMAVSRVEAVLEGEPFTVEGARLEG